MSSKNNISTYLKKRGVQQPWKLEPHPHRKFEHVIVVPAYAEYEQLPSLLDSIAENNAIHLKNILVVIVVNNSENADQQIRTNNLNTLNYLKKSKFHFQLGWVDCIQGDNSLPKKQAGVGLARKIGIDLVLPYLKSAESLIFSTDADVILHPDYLSTVFHYFNNDEVQAAVVGFRHTASDDPQIEKGIREYEEFLYNTAEKLHNAGSPYGYVAMGSTMVCRAGAYVAAGGMPRKKATEDFYFMQELAKYAGVTHIPEKLVFPSPRPVSRVYLGTGFRMKQIELGFNIQSLHYSEKAFSMLENWLTLGSSSWNTSLVKLKIKIQKLSPELMEFLHKEGIHDIWENLQKTTPSTLHFEKQFHRWFDALKTLRLLKNFLN